MITIWSGPPPARECDCDFPATRYRNGSGHEPDCPIHYWYLEDKEPGWHERAAQQAETYRQAELGPAGSAASASVGLFQVLDPHFEDPAVAATAAIRYVHRVYRSYAPWTSYAAVGAFYREAYQESPE